MGKLLKNLKKAFIAAKSVPQNTVIVVNLLSDLSFVSTIISLENSCIIASLLYILYTLQINKQDRASLQLESTMYQSNPKRYTHAQYSSESIDDTTLDDDDPVDQLHLNVDDEEEQDYHGMRNYDDKYLNEKNAIHDAQSVRYTAYTMKQDSGNSIVTELRNVGVTVLSLESLSTSAMIHYMDAVTSMRLGEANDEKCMLYTDRMGRVFNVVISVSVMSILCGIIPAGRHFYLRVSRLTSCLINLLYLQGWSTRFGKIMEHSSSFLLWMDGYCRHPIFSACHCILSFWERRWHC